MKEGVEDGDYYFSSNSSYPSPPYSEENYSFVPPSKIKLERESPKLTIKLKKTSEVSQKVNKADKRPFCTIYPNLFKIQSESSETSQEKTKSKIIAKKTNKNKVLCNMCDEMARENLEQHLFFGSLKCLDCGWTESNCENFYKRNSILSPENEYCSHLNLEWQGNILDNFMNWLGHSTLNGKSFKRDLQRYIYYLNPLAKMEPWKKAFDICKQFLSENKKKARDNSIGVNFLDLPADERYLVSKDFIEECPECYTPLLLKDYTFNVQSTLIKNICNGCDMIFYFAIDPPDGSSCQILINKI